MKILRPCMALERAGLLKGRLREIVDDIYGWEHGFYTTPMTPDRAKHVFQKIQVRHLVRIQGEPTASDALNTGIPKRFFGRWSIMDQPHCVLAFFHMTELIQKGQPSIAGWTYVEPAAVFEFWLDDEYMKIEHRRVL